MKEKQMLMSYGSAAGMSYIQCYGNVGYANLKDSERAFRESCCTAILGNILLRSEGSVSKEDNND